MKPKKWSIKRGALYGAAAGAAFQAYQYLGTWTLGSDFIGRNIGAIIGGLAVGALVGGFAAAVLNNLQD